MTAARPRLRVSVGQTWALTAGFMGGRIRVRIDSLDGKFAQATVIPSGRSMRIDVHTLERQHRGATLELEADGTAPYRAPERVPRKPVEKTASDFLKTSQPRGVVRGGKLSPLQLEIEPLLETGMTMADIGRRYGISGNAVSRHRTVILDVRALERMKESG